jgi:hypothetical protein
VTPENKTEADVHPQPGFGMDTTETDIKTAKKEEVPDEDAKLVEGDVESEAVVSLMLKNQQYLLTRLD